MGTLCKFWHGGPPAIRLLVGQTNDVSTEWLEFCPRNKMSQPLQIIQSTCLTFVSTNRFIIMPLSRILYFLQCFLWSKVSLKFLWNSVASGVIWINDSHERHFQRDCPKSIFFKIKCRISIIKKEWKKIFIWYIWNIFIDGFLSQNITSWRARSPRFRIFLSPLFACLLRAGRWVVELESKKPTCQNCPCRHLSLSDTIPPTTKKIYFCQ